MNQICESQFGHESNLMDQKTEMNIWTGQTRLFVDKKNICGQKKWTKEIFVDKIRYLEDPPRDLKSEEKWNIQ